MGNIQFEATVRSANGPLDRLQGSLPQGWTVGALRAPRLPIQDAVVDLSSPDGDSAVSFTVEVRQSNRASTVETIKQLQRLQASSALPVLYLADYINPALRQQCEAAGISYADSTGWVSIALARPLIAVRGVGDPQAPRQPRTARVERLSGVASGRIIRALACLQEPAGVRRLADVAAVSPGSVSKTLPTLVSAGAIDRDDTGRVIHVRKRALMTRWAQDYSCFNANGFVADYLAPRGIDRILGQLRASKIPLAVTGTVAGQRYLPTSQVAVVPTTRLVLYTPSPRDLDTELPLTRTSRATSNVIAIAPRDASILTTPSAEEEGLPLAPLPLVIADLMSMPGREAFLADQLMDQLETADTWWSE